jgi:hypothetical protein
MHGICRVLITPSGRLLRPLPSAVSCPSASMRRHVALTLGSPRPVAWAMARGPVPGLARRSEDGGARVGGLVFVGGAVEQGPYAGRGVEGQAHVCGGSLSSAGEASVGGYGGAN